MKPTRREHGANADDVLSNLAFANIDRHFARFLERLSGGPNRELALAAALVSRSRGEGNVCFDLRGASGASKAVSELVGDEVTSLTFPEEDQGLLTSAPTFANASGFSQEASPDATRLPEFESWVAKLRASSVVGQPEEFKPLVLDERGRLYLHRYWEYESNLAKAIRQRAGVDAGSINSDLLREGLERLFPAPAGTSVPDWQKTAAETAVRKSFCVISGGPGTGKTRTVAVVLALLLEQAGDRPLRIALAAPTGKAAARLQESIKKWKVTLSCDEAIKARLPEESFTLHRLLGSYPDSARFKHNAANPLPFDVVVVDEASMVDLALMAKLFAATPLAARLILLGDKDQLASVEAGAVLGDICGGADVTAPRSRTRESVVASSMPPSRDGGYAVADSPSLAECIVELKTNYRFGVDNGILALSQAINEGDAEKALGLLKTQPGEANSSGGITAVPLPSPARLKESLRARVFEGFSKVMTAREPLAALRALSRFRILCAVRQGPYGVETMNRLVEGILSEAGFISTRDRWYAGRPVMITCNDYQQKLFNGDVGVILPDAATGEVRAWFPGADNSLRSVPPLRLPEHETVFAMTVHKSQGSEFEEVLLVLPDRDSPVLTRELLYTGVTRASRCVEVWFNEPVLRAALARRVERTSGLRDALWGQSMVMYSHKHSGSGSSHYQHSRSDRDGPFNTID